MANLALILELSTILQILFFLSFFLFFSNCLVFICGLDTYIIFQSLA